MGSKCVVRGGEFYRFRTSGKQNGSDFSFLGSWSYCLVISAKAMWSRSAATGKNTPTLPRPENEIMRPSTEWKAAIVGRGHILPITTLHAYQAVKIRREHVIARTKNGAIQNGCHATVRARALRIRATRLVGWSNLQLARDLRLKPATCRQKSDDCGCRDCSQWIHRPPHQHKTRTKTGQGTGDK